MVRITDSERSRSFYEALAFTFAGDFDIVRDAQLEATNYFFSPAGSNPAAANPSATQPMPAKRSTMPTAGVAAVVFVPYSALWPVFANRVTASAHRCSTLAAEHVQAPAHPKSDPLPCGHIEARVRPNQGRRVGLFDLKAP
jgi:hypothetical protein